VQSPCYIAEAIKILSIKALHACQVSHQSVFSQSPRLSMPSKLHHVHPTSLMHPNSILLALVATLFTTGKACFVEHIAARAALQTTGASICVPSASPPANNIFAIGNVRVFNGNGFGNSENVLVKGNQVAVVGGATIDGVPTVGGAGKFLIPGFIESHVHPQTCSDLSVLSGYGLTTAMNMACLNYTQCAGLKSQIGTTDYITAGEIACGTGSTHAVAFGVPPQDTINAGTNLPALVDYTFGNGSYMFKIISEAGGPTTQQQTALVQATHGHDKLAVTHATLLENYEEAIESKTDGIQHTPVDGLLSSSQINQIRSQGQFVIPTMEFYKIVFANPALPPRLGFPPGSSYANVQTNVANMHKAGIPISPGTDAVGNSAGVNLPFGRTFHCELQNLAAAGFGNAEVIQAATAGAAKLYRLSDRGSIAAGMRADLVLLNSDPTLDISNTLDINSVWTGGVKVTNIQAAKGQSCDAPF